MPPEEKPIYVTRPFLPPLGDFIKQLEQIWDSRWLTNSGPFHQQLENRLSEFLGVSHVSLFTNGTLALTTALQALRITGEVITTPYSFVATTHALHWNGIQPVFADIDPSSLNLNPEKVEAAITPRTTAILAVHVYGNPCEMEKFERIANIYGLNVIYDAAHAFGVSKDGVSILKFGDLSILSFHATKIFTTFEGGAIVAPDAKTKERIDYLKNFGFADETIVVGPGINAKMTEIQAALGLLQLSYVEEVIAARKRLADRYEERLASIAGLRLFRTPASVRRNYSYYPVFVEKGFPVSRDDLYLKLREKGIFARRYFYPLISEFPIYRSLPSATKTNLPVAYKIAREVLCLPIYHGLSDEDQDRVIAVIEQSGRRGR
jgi:dTDP-4-amino-4,6-dideoxygalactose transaminase